MADEEWELHARRHPLPPRDQSRNPDQRWSEGQYWFLEQPPNTILLMEVKGHGVLRFRVTEGHADGRLRFEGIAITTQDEIYFD